MPGQPITYRLLSVSTLNPQTRAEVLRRAGLHYARPSETVQNWTCSMFAVLISSGCLREHVGGEISLTIPGELELERAFAVYGPPDIPPPVAGFTRPNRPGADNERA